jgi:hypothetical protein
MIKGDEAKCERVIELLETFAQAAQEHGDRRAWRRMRSAMHAVEQLIGDCNPNCGCEARWKHAQQAQQR